MSALPQAISLAGGNWPALGAGRPNYRRCTMYDQENELLSEADIWTRQGPPVHLGERYRNDQS